MKKTLISLLAFSLVFLSGCDGCGFGCAGRTEEKPQDPTLISSESSNESSFEYEPESSSSEEWYEDSSSDEWYEDSSSNEWYEDSSSNEWYEDSSSNEWYEDSSSDEWYEDSSSNEWYEDSSSNQWYEESSQDSSSQETEAEPTEGLAYELITGGTEYAVTGIGTATDGDIVIPATYEGLPVTKIKENAFRQNYQVTSVIIGSNVTEIEGYAFAASSKIKSIVVPDSVVRIGDHALDCSGLTSVSLGSGITYVGETILPAYPKYQYTKEGSLLYLGNENNPYVFLADVDAEEAKTITQITINQRCRVIGEKALAWCKQITDVTIPNGVVAIGNNAFESCDKLSSVTVGDNLVWVGSSIFRNCSNMQYNEDGELLYIGNSSNPYVCVIDTKTESLTEINIASGCKVIANSAFANCKQAKSATIPEGVVTIGKSAFYNCQGLSRVSFPYSLEVVGANTFVYAPLQEVILTGNVKYIGKWAFSNCSYIRNITLGSNVETIGYVAFAGCQFLESFTYQGTMEEWNKININTSLFDTKVSMKTITCSNGTVTVE